MNGALQVLFATEEIGRLIEDPFYAGSSRSNSRFIAQEMSREVSCPSLPHLVLSQPSDQHLAACQARSLCSSGVLRIKFGQQGKVKKSAACRCSLWLTIIVVFRRCLDTEL